MASQLTSGSVGGTGTGRRTSTRKSDAASVIGNFDLLLPGKHVFVLYNQLEQKGIVRFVGTTSFSDGQWVGVELQEPNGKNNGSVLGTTYFECQEGYGIFVRPKSVTRAVGEDVKTPPTEHARQSQGEESSLVDVSPKSSEANKKIRRSSKVGSIASMPAIEESLPTTGSATTDEEGLARAKAQKSKLSSFGSDVATADLLAGSPSRNGSNQTSISDEDTNLVAKDAESVGGHQVLCIMTTLLAEIRKSSEEFQKEKKSRDKSAAASRQEKKTLEYLTRRLDERMDRVDQRLDEIWKSVDQVSARVNAIEESIVKQAQVAADNSGLDNQVLTQTIKLGDGMQNTELMDVVASRVAERVRERDDELQRLTLELEGARRTMGKTAVTEVQMIALYGTEEEFLQVQRRRPWESDSHGRTAVHFAAMGGNLAVLRCAASLDADLCVADNDGLTPAHYSAACNHGESLKFLVDGNADLDAEDNEERTAVDWAQWCGHVDLVSFFSTLGKRPKMPPVDSPTAPHWAASAGHTALLRTFARSGLDLNGNDDFGMTPLHYAAACGHADAVDYLAAHGGSATALDHEHRDAVYWAHWCKRYDVMKRLASDGFKRRPPVIVVSSKDVNHEFAGNYFLQSGEPNRRLAWRTKGSKEYCLYCNESGHWCIGNSTEGEPIVQHMMPSVHAMPDSMLGPWSCWDLDAKIWVEDAGITVVEKVESRTASEWAAAHGHGGLLKCMASAGLDLDAVVQMLVKSSGVEDADDFDDDLPERVASSQSVVGRTTSSSSVLGRTTSSNGLMRYLPAG